MVTEPGDPDMKSVVLVTLVAGLLVATGHPVVSAQQSGGSKIQVFGGDDTLNQTDLFFWDDAAHASVGYVAVTYGAPTWKPQYDSMFETIKGTRVRLGKNAWTSLETT